FFSSRRRHTRSKRDWSSDVCSSDLDPAENAAPTPEPNKPTEEQKAEAAPERDYKPGEGGYSDRSAPAGGVGVIPAGNRGGDNVGPNEPDSRGGSPGDDGGRKGRGCLFWLAPLIMGAIGALAMLLLFNVFGNDDEGTGIQEGEETAVESDQEAVPEDSRNELEDIKQQIEENSGNSADGITDTTAAIQKAKKS